MNCRFIICIPTYNNPTTIAAVINETLAITSYPVLVIDDGSDTPVEKIWEDSLLNHVTSDQITSTRVTILRHSQNKGKGIALQTAFQFSVAKGFTHLIALDGDGQHLPQDIEPLVQAAESHPWSLIVGDRNMDVPHVPSSSVFGKAFSNFWIKYQTNQLVKDSQSGFRIYPLFHIQTMNFLASRYEFEIEILTRLIWKGVDVQNVKVNVQYFPPEKRVSHFNKWKDNFRISVTNSILVCLSLLREPSSPLFGALAVGIGVTVGTTPLIGLHTLIVTLIALFFRFNFVYLWLGTQISIPPLMPFLIIGSKNIGDFLFGESQLGLKIFFGSLILGSLLGLIIGSLFYINKKAFSAKKTQDQKPWTGKSKNILGTELLRRVMIFFGLRSTYFFLYFIVPYYYFFNSKARRSANEYWKISHPELSFLQRHIKIYLQLLALAKNLVDRAYQMTNPKHKFKILSFSNFDELYAPSHTGKVFICSHVGGWDMAMAFFKDLGLNQKLLAVMYNAPDNFRHTSVSADDTQVNSLFYNEEDKSILKIKAYLDNKDVVALMGDRPVGRNFELMPFFGKLALFDTTAFRIAKICKAEIFCVFSAKISAYKYEVVFEKLANEDSAEPANTQLKQYVSLLEHYLRKHPEQWFNFFNFWSDIPATNDNASR